jgi:hypothetical protein
VLSVHTVLTTRRRRRRLPNKEKEKEVKPSSSSPSLIQGGLNQILFLSFAQSDCPIFYFGTGKFRTNVVDM